MRDHYCDKQNNKLANGSIPGAITFAHTAALENFVHLQQSQAEFLAWLETSEQQDSVDGYNYRKIR